jgi:DNA-binding phage protein
MTNDPTKWFIEMLERDAAHADNIAQDWAEIGKQHGARLEDGQGHVIATAEQMVERFRGEAKVFRDVIVRAQQKG